MPQHKKYLIRYFLQLLTLCLLNWGLHVVMPVIVEALMNGMRQWNAVSVVYCWYIQLSFLIVSFSLRDHLYEQAHQWIHTQHPFMKYTLLLGVAWVLFTGVRLLIPTINGFSFLMLGELLLLSVQLYCLVGIAAPMGRWFLRTAPYKKPSFRAQRSEVEGSPDYRKIFIE